VVLRDLQNGNQPTLRVSNSVLSFENIKFEYFRFHLSSSTITFNNVEASNINISTHGGFIYTNDGYNTVNIQSSTFNNNNVTETSAGGTIFLKNGTLNCYNSHFTNNRGFQSGAIYLDTATGKIDKCNFKGDISSKESGAVFIRNSNCNIIGSTFESCSAGYGSAITSLNSTTIVTDSTFKNNKATKTNGGNIYAMYGSLTLNNCNFYNNNQIYLDNVSYTNNKNNANVYKESADVSLINTNTYAPVYSNNLAKSSSIPNKYDLRNQGYVSSVKNQGIGGNCWAFAALSALESCVLKVTGIEYDFSEENLKNLAAKYSKYGLIDRETNNGGNNLMSMGYLASWLGAVNEKDDIYSPTSCISPKLSNIINIQNIYTIKASTSTYDNKNDIKKAIMNYGAVVADYYQDKAHKYFNDKNGENYYNKFPINYKEFSGHAITIIGWDDTYSKSNFKYTAPGNGAWIVKNSWGTEWGDNGYYYLSYYDISIAKISDSYTFILNDSTNYNKNYQYDIQKSNPITSFKYYKNTFTSTGNEQLVSVSSYFDKGITYTISINVNDKQVHSQTFKSSIDGYFTVKLTKNINVGNKKFDVVISNNKNTMSICNQSMLTKKLPAGVSRVSNDGKNWIDCVSNYGFVCCIKAFTISTNLNARPAITANDFTKWYGGDEKLTAKLINAKNNKLEITINGRTYNRTADKNGQMSMAINLASGSYTTVIRYLDSNFDLKVTVLVTVKSTIVGADIVKYFRNGTQYYATFYNTKGEPLKNKSVKFNINGVFYTRQTDNKGVARLNINLNPNEYIITAENPLNHEKKSNNINVLSKLSANDLNMSYKDGSKFSVKVLDDTGKSVGAGKTVTFNVNGVFYYKTTNSQGIASLTINLRPDTYIITSSFNGENISNKIFVK